MIKLSAGRLTHGKTKVKPSHTIEIVSPKIAYVLIGSDTDVVTKDHKCAQLIPGLTYTFSSTAEHCHVTALSGHIDTPDIGPPDTEPSAHVLSIREIPPAKKDKK